jgi:hypothetical protein
MGSLETAVDNRSLTRDQWLAQPAPPEWRTVPDWTTALDEHLTTLVQADKKKQKKTLGKAI